MCTRNWVKFAHRWKPKISKRCVSVSQQISYRDNSFLLGILHASTHVSRFDFQIDFACNTMSLTCTHFQVCINTISNSVFLWNWAFWVLHFSVFSKLRKPLFFFEGVIWWCITTYKIGYYYVYNVRSQTPLLRQS